MLKMATMKYRCNAGDREIVRNVGRFFVGPNKGVIMARRMVRAWADTAATNIAVIEGPEIKLRLHNSPDGRPLITFCPTLKRVLLGAPPTTTTMSSTARPTMEIVYGDANCTVMDGPLRYIFCSC